MLDLRLRLQQALQQDCWGDALAAVEATFRVNLPPRGDWQQVSAPPGCSEPQAYQLGATLGRAGRAVFWRGPTGWAGMLGVASGMKEQEGGRPEVPEGLEWLPRAASPSPTSLRQGIYPGLIRRLAHFRLPAGSARPARSVARVGYLVWRWPPETFVQREIELLQERGLQVEVFAQESCPPEGGSWSRYWLLRHPWRWALVVGSVLSCRSHEQKSWRRDRRTLSEIFWLAEQVRVRRLDHLHSPWANPCALVVAAAARLAGCKCSVKARAHELNRVTAPDFLPWLLPQVDRVATNSDWGMAQVRPWLKAGQPLRRVHNGVRLDEFPQQPRQQRHRPQPFRLLCVARLVDPKGLDTLLRACALLRQRGLDFQCRILGGLEEPIYTYSWVELRRLRARLGLEPWVELAGSQNWSDIRAAYAWADLLALPAHVDRYGAHDVTPNCIFEAMAGQLPVLACAVGGIAEQVEHTRSAWLVEPDQPEALARALQHLWADTDLRNRLAQQALQRCQSLFDGRRQAEEWLDFLS